MFIRYFLDLPMPFEEVEEAMVASPETWVPHLAEDAEDRGEALLIEVGFGGDRMRVDKHVEVQLGVPLRIPSKTMLPMTWTPTRWPLISLLVKDAPVPPSTSTPVTPVDAIV